MPAAAFPWKSAARESPTTRSPASPDPEWVTHVSRRLKTGQTAELVAETTTQRMRQARNVGGELLNRIALLGAVGARTPEVFEQQAGLGHSYAVWTWS